MASPQSQGQPGASRARAGGFTLIEVMVALLILAVLAATAWTGVDALSTSRQVNEASLQRSIRLQSVMTQLEADLGQVIDTQIVPGLVFDGANLRLTRRTQDGVEVVVWSVRDRQLVRWSSRVVNTVGGVQDAWQRAYQLQGLEPENLIALRGVDRWLVFCFRSGSLTNCQSSGNVVTTTTPAAATASGTTGRTATGGAAANAQAAAALASVAREQLPSAVRSQLTLGADSGQSGVITRDMMLAPQQ